MGPNHFSILNRILANFSILKEILPDFSILKAWKAFFSDLDIFKILKIKHFIPISQFSGFEKPFCKISANLKFSFLFVNINRPVFSHNYTCMTAWSRWPRDVTSIDKQRPARVHFHDRVSPRGSTLSYLSCLPPNTGTTSPGQLPREITRLVT